MRRCAPTRTSPDSPISATRSRCSRIRLPMSRRSGVAMGICGARSLSGQRAAVAIGAEAQRQILMNNAQFPAAPGYEFVKPLLGHSLFDMDGDEHSRERRAMTPAFLNSHNTPHISRGSRTYWKRRSASGGTLGNASFMGRARRDVRVFLRDYHRD